MKKFIILVLIFLNFFNTNLSQAKERTNNATNDIVASFNLDGTEFKVPEKFATYMKLSNSRPGLIFMGLDKRKRAAIITLELFTDKFVEGRPYDIVGENFSETLQGKDRTLGVIANVMVYSSKKRKLACLQNEDFDSIAQGKLNIESVNNARVKGNFSFASTYERVKAKRKKRRIRRSGKINGKINLTNGRFDILNSADFPDIDLIRIRRACDNVISEFGDVLDSGDLIFKTR